MSEQLRNRYAPNSMGRMRRIHFVGIGGAGMSGIAEVMLNLGYQVTGSDQRQSATTSRLSGLGAEIRLGHQTEHVQGADAVVISSAIKEENPEVIAAREARIPVVPRAEMLAEIMRFHYGIAVAGTHGKTTTTSLIASILAEAGLDPTFVIGGRLNSAGANARLGDGEYLVAEADESDASFLCLQPMLAVVTNIDADHMTTYGGDFNRLRGTFVEFLHHLPFYGRAVLCIDDDEIRQLLPEISRPFTTYGFSDDADVKATEVAREGLKTHFTLQAESLDEAVEITLNLPGRHNVLNALAAVCVALELNIDTTSMRKALLNFAGIGRRFQTRGDCRVDGKQVMLIDDYAHHPREIEATLSAVRDGWPERRLIVVFQPHRYSRTQEQFEDFVQVLSKADLLIVSEVYAAGEEPIQGASGRDLSRAIRIRGQVDPVFVDPLDELPELLQGLLQEGDIVLTVGAGNIGSIAAELPRQLCQEVE
ncbi:MAG: UDP-N-acetylmuramate--L-alanine ligase [gamma proteobacterium symbiont of Ctena orbiculata]|uniref:UDP-N-acetylmuramate--L-alanine ligase n=1 Tax=Candidatus Thiodiazotropha taylori TaxID=2792791 RepID=A0A944M7Q0_9GAMM|nr:UDP-N-acetylmuramate--L-alanine ligase [Candidatus Thiodiazotropha taylori]PUB86702.1 MAG: UDP-N-acetylmuramate--L-alanine ligase [gamma proteobacterium symbiont of Ctena orbiculata]MBT2987789.1 UDP-N-acetylmuramate--L-alanine ligase [Candidatus Thiodiazotropha taylori]MBT2995824.1 UDP-N-acetylmuramate--L-alanine ligase [Candidatus Thiodiazotropha taylori]MBT2999139.1 UDP-N-acetylmuramate--L-alanine ligase [Candidatus Thiodiazotropha taylori]